MESYSSYYNPVNSVEQGFPYQFPTPFTLSVGSPGGWLDQNFLKGVGLTIFGPKGADNRRRRHRFRKFGQIFDESGLKMQKKIQKIWDQKFFPDTPRDPSGKRF